jgi:hypothetical protein
LWKKMNADPDFLQVGLKNCVVLTIIPVFHHSIWFWQHCDQKNTIIYIVL